VSGDAEGQQAQEPKAAKLGFLFGGTSSSPAIGIEPFKQTLRERGWIEGQTLTLVYRYADGYYERLPALAREVLDRRVAVIVTDGTPPTRAAKQATTTVPIVMATTADPVGTGLVSSLAHPGANLTGVSYFFSEINGKRIELLKEAAPHVARVAVVYNPLNPISDPAVVALETTAEALKMRTQRVAVRTPEDFDAVLALMTRQTVDAVTEGRNITVEWRFSGASDERLSNLAAELVRLKLDVIVAINTQASLAAKRATTTTPIVMTRVSDPVRTGLVASFAHPGGNITGLSNFSDELSGKRLAVIRELMPAVSRLAVLWNVGNPGIELSVREMGRASTQFGLELHLHGVKSADDVRPSLERVVRERAGALFVFDDVLMMTHKTEILNSAAKVRLPVISQYAELTEAGGLMAYGPDVSNMYRRAATYVDKILKGTRPADLPIEQPTKVQLAINLKAAKALGLTIPQTLLLQADQVIQ